MAAAAEKSPQRPPDSRSPAWERSIWVRTRASKPALTRARAQAERAIAPNGRLTGLARYRPLPDRREGSSRDGHSVCARVPYEQGIAFAIQRIEMKLVEKVDDRRRP